MIQFHCCEIDSQLCMRRCRNWQTSKTKDLVAVKSCGFKSHPPQTSYRQALTVRALCTPGA